MQEHFIVTVFGLGALAALTFTLYLLPERWTSWSLYNFQRFLGWAVLFTILLIIVSALGGLYLIAFP